MDNQRLSEYETLVPQKKDIIRYKTLCNLQLLTQLVFLSKLELYCLKHSGFSFQFSSHFLLPYGWVVGGVDGSARALKRIDWGGTLGTRPQALPGRGGVKHVPPPANWGSAKEGGVKHEAEFRIRSPPPRRARAADGALKIFASGRQMY